MNHIFVTSTLSNTARCPIYTNGTNTLLLASNKLLDTQYYHQRVHKHFVMRGMYFFQSITLYLSSKWLQSHIATYLQNKNYRTSNDKYDFVWKDLQQILSYQLVQQPVIRDIMKLLRQHLNSEHRLRYIITTCSSNEHRLTYIITTSTLLDS